MKKDLERFIKGIKPWWKEDVLGTREGRTGLVMAILVTIFPGSLIIFLAVLLWPITLCLAVLSIIIAIITYYVKKWINKADW